MTNLLMVDSAFPLASPHAADVTLIYAGGNATHAWTFDEIAAVRTDYLWPCFVRNNPGPAHPVSDDVAWTLAWLEAHQVPKGTCVILDLETTVAPAYVTAYNAGLARGGYQVAKYGSLGFIYKNPPTSGGTFVAAPGVQHMVTIADTVATQFAFDGTFDLSLVLPSVHLWTNPGGTMAITDADAEKIAAAVATKVGQHVVNTDGAITVNGVLRRADLALPKIQSSLTGLGKAVAKQGDPAAVAAAVISQLAAAGFSADEIAQHILAGLPDELALETAQALIKLIQQVPTDAPPVTPAP